MPETNDTIQAIRSAVAASLQHCIPYKLFHDKETGQWLCQWLHLDNHLFTEPFFEETVSRCKMELFNSKPFRSASAIDMLDEWSRQIDSVQPAAFIFHVSRCGSTLVSQLLSLSPENIVVAEAPFLDELLRKYKPMASEAQLRNIFQATIRFYGCRRYAQQQRVFVKTDSWHVLFYEELRKAYPGIPFILLYRNPAEVIRSQQKRRGMQSVPGVIEPELFGFDPDDVRNLMLDAYMGRVLEKYFSRFLEIAQKDPLAFPVNYNRGAETILQCIAALTSMPINAAYAGAIRERAMYHAKYPGERFREEMNLEGVGPFIQPALKLYGQLERLGYV